MKTGYYVYDFERGKFWNQSKIGYTDNISSPSVGVFDYEDAINIVKSSNVVAIESEMVHSSDFDRLESIKNEVGVKEKANYEKIFQDLTKEYYPANPFSKIFDALEKNGHYIEDHQNVKSLYNGESQRFSLFFEGKKQGLNVVISRLGTGNYEVIGNKITRENDYLVEQEKENYKKEMKKIISEQIEPFIKEHLLNVKDKAISTEELTTRLNHLFFEICSNALNKKGIKTEEISDETMFFLKKSSINESGFSDRIEKELKNSNVKKYTL